MEKKVAIITSGGDGAGINSAIEMIAKEETIDLYGFNGGFDGIVNNGPIHLTAKYCAGYTIEGKHIIQTSRSKKTFTKEGRDEIRESLKKHGFECLIVCGGNGSLNGAQLLNKEGFPTVFIPMSVDNDITGTEYTIGYDSALNRIMDVIHDLHDTAHNMPGRIFMVEVLGGTCGQLALASAIAGGADIAIINEFSRDRMSIARRVKEKLQHKDSLIILCSESAYADDSYNPGNQGVSFEIGAFIEKEIGIRVRQSVLGYYMRAGIPSYLDTIMAGKLGWTAAECIKNNKAGLMIVIKNGDAASMPFGSVEQRQKELEPQLLNIARSNRIIIEEGRKC